jgi:protein-S-isoprenylcysteine O-methyltransferase Ste14
MNFSAEFTWWVVLVFAAACVWVMVGNLLVFAFLGFFRRVFSSLGGKAYTMFLTLLFALLVTLVYSLRHLILADRIPFPPFVNYVGALLFVAGALADLWATKAIGCRRIMNYPSVLEQPRERRLTTSGPYSFSRNPLYVGDFAVAAGLFLMTGYASILLLSLLYAAHALAQARMEEKELEKIFGEEYREYMRRVPRFL